MHNEMKFIGIQPALEKLRVFQGKVGRLFIEVPNIKGERDWMTNNPNTQYDFMSNIGVLEQMTGMKAVEVWKGIRPIIVFGGAKVSSAITNDEWKKQNAWEKNWWGDCRNTFEEQLKQDTYAHWMKLDKYAIHHKNFDLKGMKVMDIGGGPVSLLLRCWNFKHGVVIDPCDYPQWVSDRYKLAGIELMKVPAEDVDFGEEKFDEAWIYNCLQHVREPAKIVDMARKHAKKIRVFELIEVGKCDGHPHNLTKEYLDGLFGKQGIVETLKDEIYYQVPCKCYIGVFTYEF